MRYCSINKSRDNLHCDNNVASLRHAVHQLENCIFDICDWMRRNAFKLNEDKT